MSLVRSTPNQKEVTAKQCTRHVGFGRNPIKLEIEWRILCLRRYSVNRLYCFERF